MKTTYPRESTLRRPTAWLPILHLLLLATLLPARAQDPRFNPSLPRDATVSLGATVSFEVSAVTTNPPLSYQWQHQGTNLDGATARTLGLTNVTELDAGDYQAIVWNASGNSATSGVAQLTVDPTFIKITTGPVVTDAEASIGASWFDYNNDGDMDLFVAVMSGGPCSLYQNNGDGSFTKVTNALTSSLIADAITAPIADFDNDGLLDLFLVRQNAAQNQLFRNTGNGSWEKLPANTFDSPCTGSSDAGWVDYDRDGFVDLFTQNGYGRNLNDALYRNLGNSTFHRMLAAEIGLGNDGAGAGGCAWSDYDNDGWPDVFLAQGIYQGGSTVETHGLFHNDGRGGFSRVADTLVGFPAAREVWVPSWIDYDSDGLSDLFMNTTGPSGRTVPLLCRNLGNGTFADVSSTTGIVFTQDPVGGEISAWGDYDNDGFPDLLILPWSRSTGPGFLYRNLGNGTFRPVNVGSPLVDGTVHQTITWADYNNDGCLDLYLSCNSTGVGPERNNLYQNNGRGAGNTNHWLKVKLNSLVSNRAAIGAKVRVQATIAGTPRTQLREISGNYGYLAREVPCLIAHFGLGDATNIDLVRIEWPSGNVTELTDLTPDRLLPVSEQNFITPVRPSVSLNGSVTLTRTVVSGATYQWQFDGADLMGQTNRTLNLTNIVADQEGRYSVVVSNVSVLVTNYVYLRVDRTFTKVTEGPVVTDRANFFLGTWADYDDDGFTDLFVPAGGDVSGQAPAFYHNLGGTNFVKLTTNEVGAVVGPRPYCFQGLWADFNNDGDLDLLEIGAALRAGGWTSSNRFFLGRPDRTFEWVAADVGVNPPVDSWQCSLVDYDNDGAVDVYYTSGWVERQSRDRLYRNRGDGTFVHAWSPTGPIGDTQYGCWSDYDNDGDRDLWLGVYGSPAQFYRNNGDGTFSGNLAGTEIPRITSFYGTWGDYDNDGYQDFLTMTALFRNDRNGGFTNVASFPEGAGYWGDYDNDGDLDFGKGYWSQQPCKFYRNDGGGVFTRVDLGSPSREVPANESLQTWGDYDNDGFLDLFVATRGNPSGTNFLYRNSGVAGGNTNHWLIVKPRGTTSNRSAIGAKVRVRATIRGTVTWQLREIQGNYFDDLRAHFGLGNAANVTTVRIEWPSGTVQELTNVGSDQILEVIEPRRPVLVLVSLTAPKVDGTVHGDPNTSYVIEFTDDLGSPWAALTTVTTDASGVASWSDASTSSTGHRYYKASRTP